MNTIYPLPEDVMQRLLQQLTSDEHATPLDYMGQLGVLPVLGVLSALWPRFVEYRGCLVRADVFDGPAIDAWISQLQGDIPQVESVVNHVHLWDVFANAEDISDVHLDLLGRLLVIAWRAAALSQFPSIKMNVELVGPEDDYGPTIYCYRCA